MSLPCRGLWRHHDFLKLWAGQATSMFGSLIGGFAYSMVAILTLHASPAQIAVLNGCSLVPGLIAGPWVGVCADRVRRRPLLIGADLGRALTLASIPLGAVTHTLSMMQLYAVATVISVLTMAFDVSFRAYVPALIGQEQLVEGNSALQGTAAVAEAGGFALAGLLVQLFTAPLAVAFDAISFLLSALSLTSIRGREAKTRRAELKGEQHSSRHDMVEGIRAVRQNAVLRALTLTAFVWDLVGSAIGVVIVLFFVRDLHLGAAVLGPIFGIGGISAFAGALLAGRVVRRWGLGRSLIGSLYVNNVGLLAVVVAGGPLPLVLTLLALGQATDGGRTIYEINAVSLLQSQAPEDAAGRIFATYEMVRSSAMLLGFLAGGILGQTIGFRAVLVLALGAHLLVPLCLVFSPLRGIRELAPETLVERIARRSKLESFTGVAHGQPEAEQAAYSSLGR